MPCMTFHMILSSHVVVWLVFHDVAHCITVLLMSAFIFTQYTDSCTKGPIFCIAMWLLCNCCNICFSNRKRIIILLPFISVPLIIASSLHSGQYCHVLCSTSLLLYGQPSIIYKFSFCTWVSSHVAASMSSMQVHTGIFSDVLMTFTFMFIPVISWTFFSVWLLWDSQSAIYKSGPGLYMMHTLY